MENQENSQEDIQLAKLMSMAKLRSFGNKEIDSQKVAEFIEREKCEAFDLQEYVEFCLEMSVKEAINKVLPVIGEAITKIKPFMPYDDAGKKAEIEKRNEELQVEVTRAIEDTDIEFIAIEEVRDTLAKLVGSFIMRAGNALLNKCAETQRYVVMDRFGHDMTTLDAKGYVEEHIRKTIKKRDENK